MSNKSVSKETLSELFRGRFPTHVADIIEAGKLTVKELADWETEKPKVYIVLTDQGLFFAITGKIRWRLRWAKIAAAMGAVLGLVWAFLTHVHIF